MKKPSSSVTKKIDKPISAVEKFVQSMGEDLSIITENYYRMDTLGEQKLDALESTLMEFIFQTNRSFQRLHNEMKDFKDEMKDFKDEMKDFKIEVRNDQKEMNKKWGDLANKMGTLVEDIIAPAFRPVIEKYFGEEITFTGVNVNKKVKSLNLSGEFDIVGVSSSYVFVVDTKSRPKNEYLTNFQKQLISFGKLFPEYGHLKLIPIFASLRFEKAFIGEASKRKIYLLAYREWEYMDILNFEEVSGKKIVDAK